MKFSVIASFALLIPVIFSCRCPILPSKEAFCRADWVSHARILSKMFLPIEGMNDVRYTLRHIKIYKNVNETCPLFNHVLTSSESSACGLVLETKKEYLLSGSYYDGEYHTSSCFQVVTDDPADSFSGNLMEWKHVTPGFEMRLNSFEC
ncbi:hypothetical protein Y032_0298g1760 [Ancylostoma ceylanicum]|nr:hypothetical protein Y032_0298g1760 [Ancylostoma ceylanicum]